MERADKRKPSVAIVYTGDGKGKTSAGIGLVCRSLGYGYRVAFVQFIKAWRVNEHAFFEAIQPIYRESLTVYRGGKGFYNAGKMSAKGVSDDQHRMSARKTYEQAYVMMKSGEYDLVVCDEINNAVHDGLLAESDLRELFAVRHQATSICLTGRHFPQALVPLADIVTDMQQTRHHYDDGFVANAGIDY